MCIPYVIAAVCTAYITVCFICGSVCGWINRSIEKNRIYFMLSDAEDCAEAVESIKKLDADTVMLFLVDCGLDPVTREELRSIMPDCGIIVTKTAEH